MGSECINGELGYAVTVKATDRISAVLPLQEHWLPLSNLDLLLPPLDFGVFFCYRGDEIANKFADFDGMVAALKASLAKVLVTYYPLAGEVVANSAGEPEVLCNNRGVDFSVAYADVELEELNLHKPDESVEKKLVPEKNGGVMSIQVTKLSCGGMVLACTFDHRIADAYTANMFLVAWAETSTASAVEGAGGKPKKPLSPPPSFRRSLLSPRRPGSHDPSVDRLYMPISEAKTKKAPSSTYADAVATNRIYYVAARDVERMQEDASMGGKRRSKLEAFSAFLWRVIGKGANKRALESCNVCRMGIVVNGRSRFKEHKEIMESYFGNVLSIPYGTMGLDELHEDELSEVADKVHDFMREATTEEHFRGLIDWVEARRPEPAAARIYLNGGDGEDDGVAFVVSSGRGFPVAEVEFGWGRPVFGSYHFPWGGSAGYVMPMPSARGGGDWVVYMHLTGDLVDVLEAEAGHIFRPLTAQYVCC